MCGRRRAGACCIRVWGVGCGQGYLRQNCLNSHAVSKLEKNSLPAEFPLTTKFRQFPHAREPTHTGADTRETGTRYANAYNTLALKACASCARSRTCAKRLAESLPGSILPTPFAPPGVQYKDRIPHHTQKITYHQALH